MKRIEMAGKQYGRWSVIAPAADVRGHANWLCRCSCGVERSVDGRGLRNGDSTSCGCYHAEAASRGKTTHGRSGSPEHLAWKGLRSRCSNPRAANYPFYGGRGITVCAPWLASFEAFLKDMGPRPSPAHSLDRIDVNGNYEPGNCRWATMRVQMRNTRANRLISVNGETLTLAEWSERTGLKRETIARRIDRSGWSAERALASSHP